MKTNILVSILLLFCIESLSQNLNWRYKFGGSYEDNCYDIEIDNSNNVYLTGGVCNSVNFDLQGGSGILNAEGNDKSDIFVAIYKSNMVLKKAFILNGSSWDYATDIEIDEEKNIYISGYYSGTIDFNPSQETYNLTSSESMYFVAKYDSIGNFKWVKNISKKKDIWGPIRSKLYSGRNANIYMSTPDTLCKIDYGGNILWELETNGFAVYDNNYSFYILSNSKTPWDSNLFGSLSIIKIDTSGKVIYDREIISNDSYMVNGYLTYDISGKLLINGDYWGTCTFNGIDKTYSITNSRMGGCGHGDIYWECPYTNEYFAKFDTTGSVIWAYDFGSNGPNPYIIETTPNGTIYSLGFLNFSADFDHTEKVAQLTNSGYGHYIAKYDSSCNFIAANKFMGGSYNDFIGEFKILDDSSSYICGHFFNTIDLALDEHSNTLSANPPEDNFIAKYSDFDIKDLTTGLLDYEAESKLILYPNPTNQYMNIEYDLSAIVKISILNINGQVELVIENYTGNPMDLSTISPGLYLLSIETTDKIIVKKILKY